MNQDIESLEKKLKDTEIEVELNKSELQSSQKDYELLESQKELAESKIKEFKDEAQFLKNNIQEISNLFLGEDTKEEDFTSEE